MSKNQNCPKKQNCPNIKIVQKSKLSKNQKYPKIKIVQKIKNKKSVQGQQVWSKVSKVSQRSGRSVKGQQGQSKISNGQQSQQGSKFQYVDLPTDRPTWPCKELLMAAKKAALIRALPKWGGGSRAAQIFGSS